MPDLQARQLQRARRRRPASQRRVRARTTSSASCAGLDADVIVMQEAWWPDDEPAAVDVAADELGAKIFELPFGRGTLDPWPHVPRDGTGQGTVGLAIISKLPARVDRHRCRSGACFADQTPDRGGAAHRARRRRERRRPRRDPPHVAAPLRPADPAPPARAAAPAAGPPRRSSPATATSGARACARSSPAGGARCSGARGRRRRPHSQIDHILVRDRRRDARSASSTPPQVLRATCGSDHRPGATRTLEQCG